MAAKPSFVQFLVRNSAIVGVKRVTWLLMKFKAAVGVRLISRVLQCSTSEVILTLNHPVAEQMLPCWAAQCFQLPRPAHERSLDLIESRQFCPQIELRCGGDNEAL